MTTTHTISLADLIILLTSELGNYIQEGDGGGWEIPSVDLTFSQSVDGEEILSIKAGVNLIEHLRDKPIFQ